MSADRDRRRQRRENNRKHSRRDRGEWSDGPRPKRKGAWNPRRHENEQGNRGFDMEDDVNDFKPF